MLFVESQHISPHSHSAVSHKNNHISRNRCGVLGIWGPLVNAIAHDDRFRFVCVTHNDVLLCSAAPHHYRHLPNTNLDIMLPFRSFIHSLNTKIADRLRSAYVDDEERIATYILKGTACLFRQVTNPTIVRMIFITNWYLHNKVYIHSGTLRVDVRASIERVCTARVVNGSLRFADISLWSYLRSIRYVEDIEWTSRALCEAVDLLCVDIIQWGGEEKMRDGYYAIWFDVWHRWLFVCVIVSRVSLFGWCHHKIEWNGLDGTFVQCPVLLPREIILCRVSLRERVICIFTAQKMSVDLSLNWISIEWLSFSKTFYGMIIVIELHFFKHM